MNPEADLSQLKDFHLPDPITWWPPAIGWWILAVVSLTALGFLVRFIMQRHRRLRYKREAKTQLQTIINNAQTDDNRQLLVNLSNLVKRVAITRYGRRNVAGLTEQSWLHFLDNTGNTLQFSQGPGKALVTERYRPNPDIHPDEVIAVVREWLDKQS